MKAMCYEHTSVNNCIISFYSYLRSSSYYMTTHTHTHTDTPLVPSHCKRVHGQKCSYDGHKSIWQLCTDTPGSLLKPIPQGSPGDGLALVLKAAWRRWSQRSAQIRSAHSWGRWRECIHKAFSPEWTSSWVAAGTMQGHERVHQSSAIC